MTNPGFFDPAPEGIPDPLPPDPLPTLAAWLEEAARRRLQPNPNAMCLATVGPQARPSARVVLCKRLVAEPGYVVFYTNYSSRKGLDLAAHACAAAVFHWDALGRQARIEGPVVRSPTAESDAYFDSRTWRSQLAAAASDQSRPIRSRQAMVDRVRAKAASLGIEDLDAVPRDSPGPAHIPRPADWGGYRLWIESIELWVAGAARVHDRARWQRPLTPSDSGFEFGTWSAGRLQP
ncbi:pyridoxamine 5'-phosphate oxidase [soil metagenome]